MCPVLVVVVLVGMPAALEELHALGFWLLASGFCQAGRGRVTPDHG